MLLADGDDLDFHQSIFRQTCYFDAGAGRAILFEIFGVGRVHRAKVIHVLDEDGGFDDIVQRAAGSCQNRLDILQRLAGLPRYAAFGKLAGCRNYRQLPGYEQETVRFNGLGVRADCPGSLIGINNLFHNRTLFSFF